MLSGRIQPVRVNTPCHIGIYRFITKFENTAVQGTPSAWEVTAMPASEAGFIGTVMVLPTVVHVLPCWLYDAVKSLRFLRGAGRSGKTFWAPFPNAFLPLASCE